MSQLKVKGSVTMEVKGQWIPGISRSFCHGAILQYLLAVY